MDLTANCVAHWKLDENYASQIVIDSVGDYNGLAQQNTEDLAATGKVGGALTFNGSSDYIDCNNPFESVFQDSFSMSLWAKPDDGIPTSALALYGCLDGPDNNEVSCMVNTNGSILASYHAGGDKHGYATPVFFENGPAAWTMVTVTMENLGTKFRVKIYVNAALLKDSGERTADMSSYTSSIDLFIGAEQAYDHLQLPFDGLLDNVMIFNKALSQDEINFLYGNGTMLAGMLTEMWGF